MRTSYVFPHVPIGRGGALGELIMRGGLGKVSRAAITVLTEQAVEYLHHPL